MPIHQEDQKMPEESTSNRFETHFGFLEKDYGFQIIQTAQGFGTLYLASTDQ
jgi:hypothetical protein